MAGLEVTLRRVRKAADELLHAFAQIVFSRSRIVGSLLLLATFTHPREGLFGCVGFGAAALFAQALGLYGEGLGKTPYGPNALLVSLGVAHTFGTTPAALGLLVAAAAGGVLMTAALGGIAGRLGGVPIFSLPFVAVMWLAQMTSAANGLVDPLGPSIPPPTFDVAPSSALLSGMGGLLFAPQVVAGGLVLAALLVHSRISTLLALTGVLATLPLASGSLGSAVLLNGALSAMALGGVFFVPSTSAFLVGGVGALLSGVLTVVIAGPLEGHGLVPLILPFAASAVFVLLAMGQRGQDQSPKSVDFVPGSPEENLAYYRLRVARFRAPYAVAFSLPFRGAWTCTQGVDGEITHKAEWRHAFDFEVAGDDGELFRGDGTELSDHHCFKLPVVATADGIVVKVENDVPDNAVGGLDLARNWGNVVVLQHAPGLFSLVAHLARGTVRVREGESVKKGHVLGACGNSGRSPRPHLHFQLQATGKVGAPTLACRFSDGVFRRDGGDVIDSAAVPTKGDIVRNVEQSEPPAGRFSPDPGTVIPLRTLSLDASVEHLESDVDLLGHRILRSRETGAVLYFGCDDRGFTAYDVLGDSKSALHLVRAALGRMPLDQGEPTFSDYLPSRWGKHLMLRPLADFIAPFVPDAGLLMTYRIRREEGRVVVSGESKKQRGGAPVVRTLAVFSAAHGLELVEVKHGTRRVSFVSEESAASGAPQAFEQTPQSWVIRQKAAPKPRRRSMGQKALSLGETS